MINATIVFDWLDSSIRADTMSDLYANSKTDCIQGYKNELSHARSSSKTLVGNMYMCML